MSEASQQDALDRWAAMSAIIFAVLAAMAGILGQGAANAALQLQGRANLDKVEMTNQWAFFQSRRIKMSIYGMQSDLLQRLKLGALSADVQTDLAQWEQEDRTIREKAAALQRSADENTRAAEFRLRQNDRFDVCVALLQLAIAVASMSVLVKRSVVLYAGVAIGLAGFVAFLFAWRMWLA